MYKMNKTYFAQKKKKKKQSNCYVTTTIFFTLNMKVQQYFYKWLYNSALNKKVQMTTLFYLEQVAYLPSNYIIVA